MLTGQYRRVYYYHLKKCGGSTLNPWLDTLTSDARVNDPRWIGSWLFGDPAVEATAAQTAKDRIRVKSVFQWSDVIHSHACLLPHVPDRTFRMTVLRNPADRLVSQVFDWRRLTSADAQSQPAHIRACVADSRTLPVRSFLKRHGYGDGRMFLDNFLTRALAAARVGRLVLDIGDPARLLDIALASLEQDFDLVGLTEHLDLTRNAFCALMGLPAARGIDPVNRSRKSEAEAPELLEAGDIVEDLTRIDRVVYERACRLFEQRYRDVGQLYSDVDFEARHASSLLSELRGCYDRQAARFSVRDPLMGSGFHGRDGSGLTQCAVWTGPECATTLYFPAPVEMPVSVLVWIRGYADARQRAQLRVRVNGKPVPHRFVTEPGYADLLVADTYSDKDFIRLDLELDETIDTGIPGSEFHDPRRKGLAFDSYGWRRP